MKRVALALAATLALPAAAQEMTDAERQALRGEIRSYLIEHPEVLMEAIQVLDERQAEQQVNNDLAMLRDNADAIYNDPASWVGGNPEGDVTVVEFMDYRCGYCRQAYEEVEKLVAADGNIRFVLKEYPILGEQSLLASRFAIAVKQIAGEDEYKAVHDRFYEMRGDINDASLKRISDDMGLDTEAVMAAMTSDEVTKVIADNHALGQTLQINGTPTFIIDETMVRGYVPQQGMQQIVTQMREKG